VNRGGVLSFRAARALRLIDGLANEVIRLGARGRVRRIRSGEVLRLEVPCRSTSCPCADCVARRTAEELEPESWSPGREGR
jgi:hypothetical protein